MKKVSLFSALIFISLPYCLHAGKHEDLTPNTPKIFIINHTPAPLLYNIVKYGFFIPKYEIEPGQTKVEKIFGNTASDFVCWKQDMSKLWGRVVLLKNDTTIHIENIKNPVIRVTYKTAPTAEEFGNNQFIRNLFVQVFEEKDQFIQSKTTT